MNLWPICMKRWACSIKQKFNTRRFLILSQIILIPIYIWPIFILEKKRENKPWRYWIVCSNWILSEQISIYLEAMLFFKPSILKKRPPPLKRGLREIPITRTFIFNSERYTISSIGLMKWSQKWKKQLN